MHSDIIDSKTIVIINGKNAKEGLIDMAFPDVVEVSNTKVAMDGSTETHYMRTDPNEMTFGLNYQTTSDFGRVLAKEINKTKNSITNQVIDAVTDPILGSAGGSRYVILVRRSNGDEYKMVCCPKSVAPFGVNGVGADAVIPVNFTILEYDNKFKLSDIVNELLATVGIATVQDILNG